MLDTMNSPRQPTPSEPETSGIGLMTILFVVLGFALGGLAHFLLQVNWLAGIQASLAGSDPTAFWYLSRATAFVGFGLLWLSMASGLAITNKLARLWPGGPAAAGPVSSRSGASGAGGGARGLQRGRACTSWKYRTGATSAPRSASTTRAASGSAPWGT